MPFTVALNFYTVSSLFASFFCFGIAALTHFKGSECPERKPFIQVSFLIGVWTLFPFITSCTSNPTLQTFFGRIVYVAAAVAPMAFALLVRALLETTSKGFQAFIKISKYASAFFVVITFHPIFIAGLQSSGDFRAVDPGPLYHVYILYFVIYCALSFVELPLGYRHAEGIKRNQLKYIFIGFLIAYFAGTLHFLAVYIHAEPIPHDIFIIVCMMILAYAIVRYHLMDINLALRYTTINIIFAVGMSVPIAVVYAIGHSSIAVMAVSFLMFFLSTSAYKRVSAALTRTVDKLPPFEGRYERYLERERWQKEVGATKELKEWAGKMLQAAVFLFQPKSASVLLVSKQMKGFFPCEVAYNIEHLDTINLETESYLVRRFSNDKGALVRTLAAGDHPPSEFKKISEAMKDLQAEISIPFFMEGRLQAVLNMDKRADGSMYHDLDYTTQWALERAGEEALRAILLKQEYTSGLASIAHDLEKPFTSKGSLVIVQQLLQGKRGSVTPEQKEGLEIILYDYLMTGKQLQLLAKGGTGEGLSLAPTALTETFSMLEKRYQNIVKEHGIKFIADLPPADLEVVCDASVIALRVIGNLVNNALRYIEVGGTIRLSYEVRDGKFVGKVVDTGKGIKKEDLGKIFEKGFKDPSGGGGVAGLGLYNVREIVRRHGGDAWAESEGQGRGSTFYFTLRLAKT